VGANCDILDSWTKRGQIVIPRSGGGADGTSAAAVGDGIIQDEMAGRDFLPVPGA